MATIRPEFHTSLVSQMLDDIYYQRSSYYYFLGRIDTWGSSDTPPSAPANTLSDDITIRNNLLYLRKIDPSDVSLVTTRSTWTSGTVYDQWDHTLNMQDLTFFVVTDEYNVYKCLNNNAGAASTIKPTTTSLFPISTSDGYVWKYMYNVPSFKRRKFLSRGYLPVQKALTDSFYNKGAVEQVIVTASGSGYTDNQLTTIDITGTTTGEGATAEITTVDSLGTITEVTVTDGGSGYTAGAIVTVTSSTGINADIQIVADESGVITDVTIVNGGAGYEVTDEVSITVGGAELTPVVSRTTGSIQYVRIDNPGAGYTAAPTLEVVQYPETGTGQYGNATAVVTAFVYEGSIVNVTVEDPGIDYPSDTATTIVVSGDGTDASFSPVVYNGEIVDVIVENPGSDYSYINLTVVGAGTDAEIRGALATSDFLSDQSQVEQVAVSGAIYAVVVTEAGDNYSEETTVTIDGDGEGATAYPVISEDGTVEQIIITAAGSGYTQATVTFTDPNRPTPNDFTDAEAYVTLPPVNGHGYNAVKELYGDTISVFTSIHDDTALNLIAQDYRQYGLLVNPTDLLTSKRITSSTNVITFNATLNTVDGLSTDDVLICNDKRYRVVAIDGGTDIQLQQLSSIYTQPDGAMYMESDPLQEYVIQQVTSVPSVNKYSGNLLYVTNNAPFTPTNEQTIAIRTYIKL